MSTLKSEQSHRVPQTSRSIELGLNPGEPCIDKDGKPSPIVVEILDGTNTTTRAKRCVVCDRLFLPITNSDGVN
jgi:hypothetical protein